MEGGWIYITSNKIRSILYIGVTSDIAGRIWEHKNHIYEKSFTKRYHVTDLVYYEFFDSIEAAIRREKQLKRWRRDRKFNLIYSMNPKLEELYDEEFIKNNS